MYAPSPHFVETSLFAETLNSLSEARRRTTGFWSVLPRLAPGENAQHIVQLSRSRLRSSAEEARVPSEDSGCNLFALGRGAPNRIGTLTVLSPQPGKGRIPPSDGSAMLSLLRCTRQLQETATAVPYVIARRVEQTANPIVPISMS